MGPFILAVIPRVCSTHLCRSNQLYLCPSLSLAMVTDWWLFSWPLTQLGHQRHPCHPGGWVYRCWPKYWYRTNLSVNDPGSALSGQLVKYWLSFLYSGPLLGDGKLFSFTVNKSGRPTEGKGVQSIGVWCRCDAFHCLALYSILVLMWLEFSTIHLSHIQKPAHPWALIGQKSPPWSLCCHQTKPNVKRQSITDPEVFKKHSFGAVWRPRAPLVSHLSINWVIPLHSKREERLNRTEEQGLM